MNSYAYFNMNTVLHCYVLTLILPIATIVPYPKGLDPNETPSNSVSHPDESCLTLRE